MDKCDWCGTGEIEIHFTGETNSSVCNHCFNAFMSEKLNIEMGQLIEYFTIEDGEGNNRIFYVKMRIDPTGIYLEAKENKNLDYQFAVHGQLNDDQHELLKRLMGKVRKGIRYKQIETNTFPNGQIYHSLVQDHLAGRFEYDEASDGLPLVLIDGKPFTWEEFGKILMTYEGFQFKLRMYDMTDDVE